MKLLSKLTDVDDLFVPFSGKYQKGQKFIQIRKTPQALHYYQDQFRGSFIDGKGEYYFYVSEKSGLQNDDIVQAVMIYEPYRNGFNLLQYDVLLKGYQYDNICQQEILDQYKRIWVKEQDKQTQENPMVSQFNLIKTLKVDDKNFAFRAQVKFISDLYTICVKGRIYLNHYVVFADMSQMITMQFFGHNSERLYNKIRKYDYVIVRNGKAYDNSAGICPQTINKLYLKANDSTTITQFEADVKLTQFLDLYKLNFIQQQMTRFVCTCFVKVYKKSKVIYFILQNFLAKAIELIVYDDTAVFVVVFFERDFEKLKKINEGQIVLFVNLQLKGKRRQRLLYSRNSYFKINNIYTHQYFQDLIFAQPDFSKLSIKYKNLEIASKTEKLSKILKIIKRSNEIGCTDYFQYYLCIVNPVNYSQNYIQRQCIHYECNNEVQLIDNYYQCNRCLTYKETCKYVGNWLVQISDMYDSIDVIVKEEHLVVKIFGLHSKDIAQCEDSQELDIKAQEFCTKTILALVSCELKLVNNQYEFVQSLVDFDYFDDQTESVMNIMNRQNEIKFFQMFFNNDYKVSNSFYFLFQNFLQCLS